MSDLCRLIWHILIGLFRSRAALEAEILVLRHQLNVLRRSCPKRVALSSIDRLLRHGRRELLWLGVTARPNAEWIARQLTEAYGWQDTPRYIIRDRDRVYGHVFRA
jgi:hypothetical protein